MHFHEKHTALECNEGAVGQAEVPRQHQVMTVGKHAALTAVLDCQDEPLGYATYHEQLQKESNVTPKVEEWPRDCNHREVTLQYKQQCVVEEYVLLVEEWRSDDIKANNNLDAIVEAKEGVLLELINVVVVIEQRTSFNVLVPPQLLK
jgi:hypothetical protein